MLTIKIPSILFAEIEKEKKKQQLNSHGSTKEQNNQSPLEQEQQAVYFTFPALRIPWQSDDIQTAA